MTASAPTRKLMTFEEAALLDPDEAPGEALEYLAAGARVVWVLDPDLENVTEFVPGRSARVLDSGEMLDGSATLPGFACRVEELFE